MQNAVFIDRDGTHFRHILNWLRDGVIPLLDPAAYTELQREAQFYQLNVCLPIHTLQWSMGLLSPCFLLCGCMKLRGFAYHFCVIFVFHTRMKPGSFMECHWDS